MELARFRLTLPTFLSFENMARSSFAWNTGGSMQLEGMPDPQSHACGSVNTRWGRDNILYDVAQQ